MDLPGWAAACAVAAAGAAAGLATGCYLTVLVARVPAGENVLRPAGRCPRCAAGVRAADMIPLAGWLRLRGRCRACGSRYGAWYPALELITAALFAVMALRFGFGPLLPAVWYLTAVGVALAFIDLRLQRLPDALTLPSYPVALVLLGAGGLLLPGGGRHLVGALAGMGAALLFYLVLVLVYPAGIGWGDVKLAGLVGLYLGWFGTAALVSGLFGAFALAAVTGLALIAARRATRKSQLPLGPFMLAAALAVIAAGGLYPSLAH
jgi:leader peptidase (prepilin peptidase)/N-methyltransferase